MTSLRSGTKDKLVVTVVHPSYTLIRVVSAVHQCGMHLLEKLCHFVSLKTLLFFKVRVQVRVRVGVSENWK